MTAARSLPPGRSYGPVLGVAWTAKEQAALRALYVSQGIQACLRALPGRTERSIYHAARRLGLKTHRVWTATEDRIVRSEWGYSSLEGIARMLGRSSKAVYQHARVDLEMGMGAPEGSEYVTNAAIRTGFPSATFHRVLAYAGVKPRKVPTRPTGRVKFHAHYVDPFDVDEAVAAWMASEDVEPAAKARRMTGGQLMRWLKVAGVTDLRKVKRGRWRVQTVTIDRVIAEERARIARCESIAGAAARYGVPASTMRCWLVGSGVVLTGKPWRIEPAEVDRAVKAWEGRRRRR